MVCHDFIVAMIICFRPVQWLVICLFCFQAAQLLGQEGSKGLPLLVQTNNSPLKLIGDGIFQIGEVRLDKNKKTVSFPGSVNLTNVVIEYAVVGSVGKLHESLLATQAETYHIHLAMLLLGMTNQTASVESGQPLTGTPIYIWVTWKSDGKDQKVRLEDLICKQQHGKPMARGIWIYNGSRVLQGVFMAQASGSIASIIEDIDALINNPRKGREDDTIWFPNEKVAPPLNVPLTIILEAEQKF